MTSVFTNKSKTPVENLVFSLIFNYLFFISFVSSFYQCLSFLIYSEKNYFITLLAYVFLVLNSLAFVLSVNFQKHFFAFVFNSFTLNYVIFLSKKMKQAAENSSFWGRFFVQGFLLFSFFHLLFAIQSIENHTFELIYQCFNLVRLIFFPCFLLGFALHFNPHSFSMEGLFSEFTDKGLRTVLKEWIKNLAEFTDVKKNPKGAALVIGAALIGAIAVEHQDGVKKTLHTTVKDFKINVGEAPQVITNDLESVELFRKGMHAWARTNDSPLNLGLHDLKAFVTRKPTTREEIITCFPELRIREDQFLVNQALANQTRENAMNLSMSPLAVSSIQKDGLVENDLVVNGSPSLQPKIQSILEFLFF